MDAIRELVNVEGRTLTIRLPDHFHAKRVEVIVLDASEPDRTASAGTTVSSQPSALLAGTRILGDIMAPAVEADAWDALK